MTLSVGTEKTMFKRKILTAGAAVALLAGTVGGGIAYAGSQDSAKQEAAEGPEENEAGEEQREAEVLAGARISLATAVQAAEARTGMKASEAGINDEGGQPMFEVSFGQGGQERTALVDTQSGQVVKVVADAEEGEGGED